MKQKQPLTNDDCEGDRERVHLHCVIDIVTYTANSRESARITVFSILYQACVTCVQLIQ